MPTREEIERNIANELNKKAGLEKQVAAKRKQQKAPAKIEPTDKELSEKLAALQAENTVLETELKE